MNDKNKSIMFCTLIDSKMANDFDKIAEDNFRSRAQHLQFIIEKEIEFHKNKKHAEKE